MRAKEFIEAKSYQAPEIKAGDTVKVGKFKNRKATVKSISKDKNNQPVLQTDKGEHKLFKPRIDKLEEGTSQYNILRQLSDAASTKYDVASKELAKFPKGSMGMTPDAVKQDPKWRALKKECDTAFKELRYYNGLINKNHKKEHQVARAAERAKRYNVSEGGWSSVATQNTVITPQTIADAVPVMKSFQDSLNKFLAQDSIPPIKIGNPVGSGTYYKRDLKNDPDKEYGDIDVQFIMPRVESKSNNQVQQMYFNAVQEFCRLNANFETDNGKNVIFQIGTDFIQVDLVAIFDDRLKFTKALAPEHGTKGVLSGSLYSALGQALNISISDAGIQGKTIDDKLVSYRKSKGTKLNTISTDHKNWAIDIARFMGAKTVDPLLSKNPGMQNEVKIADIINSFKGIALTLDRNQLLPDSYDSAEALIADVRDIYLQKINAVINSSKFDKAEGDAVAKAAKTKDMLATRSAEIAGLF